MSVTTISIQSHKHACMLCLLSGEHSPIVYSGFRQEWYVSLELHVRTVPDISAHFLRDVTHKEGVKNEIPSHQHWYRFRAFSLNIKEFKYTLETAPLEREVPQIQLKTLRIKKCATNPI